MSGFLPRTGAGFPAAKPVEALPPGIWPVERAGRLVFREGKRTVGSVFDRYSQAWHPASEALVPSGQMRLLGAGGATPAMMLEPQRTNLLTDSSSFTLTSPTTNYNRHFVDHHLPTDEIIEPVTGTLSFEYQARGVMPYHSIVIGGHDPNSWGIRVRPDGGEQGELTVDRFRQVVLPDGWTREEITFTISPSDQAPYFTEGRYIFIAEDAPTPADGVDTTFRRIQYEHGRGNATSLIPTDGEAATRIRERLKADVELDTSEDFTMHVAIYVRGLGARWQDLWTLASDESSSTWRAEATPTGGLNFYVSRSDDPDANEQVPFFLGEVLPDWTWHATTITWDASEETLRTYCDGALGDANDDPIVIPPSFASLYLGDGADSVTQIMAPGAHGCSIPLIERRLWTEAEVVDAHDRWLTALAQVEVPS